MTTTPAGPTGGLAKLGAMFRTDPVKENEGTWMPVADGVEFKVRSSQSDKALEVSKALLSRYKAAFSVGARLDQAQTNAYEIGFCAEGLVTDWKGLTDDADQGMACTGENVTMIVTEMPHLRRMIINYSESLQNYRPDPK